MSAESQGFLLQVALCLCQRSGEEMAPDSRFIPEEPQSAQKSEYTNLPPVCPKRCADYPFHVASPRQGLSLFFPSGLSRAESAGFKASDPSGYIKSGNSAPLVFKAHVWRFVFPSWTPVSVPAALCPAGIPGSLFLFFLTSQM